MACSAYTSASTEVGLSHPAKELEVNGKLWNNVFLPYREIARGGRLVFTMGPQPNKQWGADSVLPKTE